MPEICKEMFETLRNCFLIERQSMIWKRKVKKYFISNIKPERYKKSAVPSMKRMRNAMKNINSSMSPENIVNLNPISVKI